MATRKPGPGRPRGSGTRKRTPAARPAPDIQEDVIGEAPASSAGEDQAPASGPAPRASRPGPKTVLKETGKVVSDALAVGILVSTKGPDPRLNLTVPEAQSISSPLVRMLGRRVPAWLKNLLPKSAYTTKISPEDLADIEEILATLAKVGMRAITLFVQDFILAREKAEAQRAQASGQGQRPAALHVMRSWPAEDQGQADAPVNFAPPRIEDQAGEMPITPSPAASPFDAIGGDFGMEAV